MIGSGMPISQRSAPLPNDMISLHCLMWANASAIWQVPQTRLNQFELEGNFSCSCMTLTDLERRSTPACPLRRCAQRGQTRAFRVGRGAREKRLTVLDHPPVAPAEERDEPLIAQVSTPQNVAAAACVHRSCVAWRERL
jgi:hypothetical protein